MKRKNNPIPMDIRNLIANGFGVEDIKVRYGWTWRETFEAVLIAGRDGDLWRYGSLCLDRPGKVLRNATRFR